jgi:hypothetical protein
MASNFQSQDNIPPMEKAAQAAGVVSGLADTAGDILNSFTSFLAGAGLSGGGAGSSATSAVDGIVGEGDPGYTTGKATSRATSSDLRDMRSGTSPDQPSGQKYSTQISPQGRIGGRYNTEGETDGLEVYPPDLGKYYMRLDFMDYERPAPFTAATVLTEYSVALPVPAGLVEYYDNKWDTPDLGIIGDIADAFTRKDGSLLDTAASTAGAGIRRAIGNVSDAAGVAISQGLGAIPNPNVTAAFRGPNLRQFSFSWTFAPKTPEESKKIQAIVRGIKKRILPIMNSGTTSLLGYPSMIQPSLFLGVNEGKSALFQFKKCVMPRMNVSYSPTGIPTFFKSTNLPTFVQLAITLVEIEYWTEDDKEQVVGSENKLAAASDQIQVAGNVNANTGG